MQHRLELAALALIAVFAPIQPVILTVLVLCVVDLITGIWASGSRMHSSGLKATVLKFLVYETAILLSFLVGEYLTGPAIPVLNLVAGMVGITELKSVLENLDIISGGSLMKKVAKALQKNISGK